MESATPYPDDELQTATPAAYNDLPSNKQDGHTEPSNPFYITSNEGKQEEPVQGIVVGERPVRKLSQNKIVGSPDNALCFKKLAKTKSGNPILLKLSGSFIKDDTKSETKLDHNERQSILSFTSGTPKSGCTLMSKDKKLNKTADTTFSVLSKLSDTICDRKDTKKEEIRSQANEDHHSGMKSKTAEGPTMESVIPLKKSSESKFIPLRNGTSDDATKPVCCCSHYEKNNSLCCSIV